METVSLDSSAIRSVSYDSESRRMHIIFKKGDTYTFCRVPRSIFEGLINASSAGRYYDLNIRDRYQC